MKHTFLLDFLLCIAIVSAAQDANNIVIGKTDTIFSAVLQEKRSLLVYTPALTSRAVVPNQHYPVIYVLDGEAHFISTVGMVQQLSQANGNSVLPECIVIGITNTNRLRDLAPTDKNGAGNFVKFIEKELIPYVDGKYPTAPYKVLIGHSLGGLTAIDMLTRRSDMFNGYIAIDPSLWFNNESTLREAMVRLPSRVPQKARLFIGTANTMPKKMTLQQVVKDGSEETRHIRAICKLDGFLKTRSVPGLLYANKFYASETHVSVPLICEYDGLRFIFDYYLMDVSEKDIQDPSDGIALRYRAHYDHVSAEMGYKVAPPEDFINYLGMDALNKGQFKKAMALLLMNLENFPNSDRAYAAYGDLLSAQRDTAGAVRYYKKSLAIAYNAATAQKMQMMLRPPESAQRTVPYSLSEQELMQYTGNYIIEQYQVPVVLVLRNGQLWANTPDQPDSELEPVGRDLFQLRGKQGYTITFQRQEGKVVSFTSVQPNGTFQITKR